MKQSDGRPWLRHVGEATSATAHSIVVRVIDAIDGGRVQMREDPNNGGFEVLVDLGMDDNGMISSAACMLGAATLEVRVPATAEWGGDFLFVNGDVHAADGSEPATRLRGALELWRAGLSPAIGSQEGLAAARVVDGCAVLLRAAAQTLDPGWTAAAVATHGLGVHSVLVERDATGPIRSCLFSSEQQDAPSGTISPELDRAFDALFGDRTHVTRIRMDPRYLLPRLQIGPPPAVRIVNDGDAMATMRAVAALPPGARLLPP